MSQTFFTSGITPTWIYRQESDKAEAIQMFHEAENWVNLLDDTTVEETSEDWKIIPIYALDPEKEAKWKQDRLWMIDPMDGILGDDAMPALCASCNGVFWGDEMISIRKTILRLRNKHNHSINGMLGNIWEEVEGSIVRKIRVNRICKKCFRVSVESRMNPWSSDYGDSLNIPAAQLQLPFNQMPTNFPNLSSSAPLPGNNSNNVLVSSTGTITCSGMAPPPGGWKVSYSDV